MARLGRAWQGTARPGKARRGAAGQGMARPGVAGAPIGAIFIRRKHVDQVPEVQAAIDKIFALTANLDRGDTLTHDAIREVLHLEPHQGRWGHIMNQVRRRLEREHGIATWADYTVGYRLLTEVEQLQVPTWRTKKRCDKSARACVRFRHCPMRA